MHNCVDTFCYRLTILIFAVFTFFGAAFIYDVPGSLQPELKHIYGIKKADFSVFYSIFSWPNVVVPFLGGLVVDRFGLRITSTAAYVVVLIGHGIFAYSAYTGSFVMGVVGRGIYGLGAETVFIGVALLATKWFEGRSLSFALGLIGAFDGLSEYTSFVTIPLIASAFDYKIAILFSIGIVFLGIICWIAASSLDKFGEKHADVEFDEESDIDLKSIRKFPLSYWLVCVEYTISFSAIYVVNSVMVELLVELFMIKPENAGFVAGTPYLVLGVLSPIFGVLFDKFGRRNTFGLVGLLIYIGSLLSLLYSNIPILVSLSFLGVSYALLFSTLSTLVTLTVSQNRGTAFGLATSLHSLGLALLFVAVGYISQHYGYRITLLCSCAITTLPFASKLLNEVMHGDLLNINQEQFNKQYEYKNLQDY